MMLAGWRVLVWGQSVAFGSCCLFELLLGGEWWSGEVVVDW